MKICHALILVTCHQGTTDLRRCACSYNWKLWKGGELSLVKESLGRHSKGPFNDRLYSCMSRP